MYKIEVSKRSGFPLTVYKHSIKYTLQVVKYFAANVQNPPENVHIIYTASHRSFVGETFNLSKQRSKVEERWTQMFSTLVFTKLFFFCFFIKYLKVYENDQGYIDIRRYKIGWHMLYNHAYVITRINEIQLKNRFERELTRKWSTIPSTSSLIITFSS